VKDEYRRNKEILLPPRRAGVFIERQCVHGVRGGLIAAFDLECYDWHGDSKTLIRATEETIVERLPPRVEIRMNAPLECPHVLVLIDDEQNILMQLLVKILKKAPFAYDSPLMFGGGAVSGRLLYRKNDWDFIADSLNHLLRRSQTLFGTDFVFAVGDGNHSFATAKEVWTRYKAEHAGEAGIERHPARWALAEIVNLHDSAVVFKPIHRLLLNVTYEAALAAVRKLPGFSAREVGSQDELIERVADAKTANNRYGIVSRDKLLLVEAQGGYAATIDAEPLLIALVRETRGAAIDYVHGDAELFEFARKAGAAENVGILFPPFRKEGFFKSVVKNGPLPRKSFSMGEASEKRYYLECRKLFC
jgi:hypothetical protein